MVSTAVNNVVVVVVVIYVPNAAAMVVITSQFTESRACRAVRHPEKIKMPTANTAPVNKLSTSATASAIMVTVVITAMPSR